MNLSDDIRKTQRSFARKALAHSEHRFQDLWHLLGREDWVHSALAAVLTNAGARTAGIDGVSKLNLETETQQQDFIIALRQELRTGTYHPTPVRRVWIPKPGKDEKRPLGIPTLTDRLVQMMMKAILEPIFESDFFPTSHGFRPQHSCHTALAQLHQMTAPKQKKMNWVIEGDIVGCFDHVQHKILLRLLRRRIQDRKLLDLVWQMLRAGVMEGTLFKKTSEGTPQGGIVSPLLANIYLHEIDQWMDEQYLGLNYNEKNRRRRRKEGNAFYVRYADDFVIAWNGTKEGAHQLKAKLTTFLRENLGLELSEEKTHITHITDGYDFLGFTVKRHIDAQRGYNELKFYPSKKSVMKLKAKIKSMTERGTTLASVRDKIEALNYLLRGWAEYYRHSAASSTFSYVGSYAFKRMELWIRKKTRQRVKAIYRRYYRKDRWLTWADGGRFLYHTSQTTIRYKRYAHLPNPYLDNSKTVELPYHLDPHPGKREWDGTNSRYGEEWTEKREEVRVRDGNQCALCGSRDRVEVHHIRKHKGKQGHNTTKMIALCASCHRQARNPQSDASRKLARHNFGTGEPDEAEVSRPVREGV